MPDFALDTLRIAQASPASPETVEYVMLRTRRDAKVTAEVLRVAIASMIGVREILDFLGFPRLDEVTQRQ